MKLIIHRGVMILFVMGFVLLLFNPIANAINFSSAEIPDLEIDSLAQDTVARQVLFPGLPDATTELYGPHNLPVTTAINPRQLQPAANKTFATFWIIVSLLIVALARYTFPFRFRETLRAFWESRYFNLLERESGLLNHWVSLFLYVNFLFALSLMFYQTISMFGAAEMVSDLHPALILVYGFLFSAAFIFLKFILIYFVSWVFGTGKPTNLYLRNYVLAGKFTGVAILPVLILNNYIPAAWLLLSAWGLFATIEVYRLIKGASVGLRIQGFSTYHLILYLCAVEFVPVIFLFKYSEILI